MKKSGIIRILGLVVVVSAAIAGVKYLGLYSRWQSTSYDLFLRAARPVPEDPRLLLVDIDDPTIATINMYPLSRDITADGLVLLREAGAETAILDIEFVDTSPRGVNESYLREELPARFDDTFSDLDEYARGIVSAVAEGRIDIPEAEAFLEDFSSDVAAGRDDLLEGVVRVVRDNDEYLGRALALFGNTFVTVNMLNASDPTVPPELLDYTLAGAYGALKVGGDPFAEAGGIKPAIYPIISRSTGFGFPRVHVDSDGVRRRIDLFYRFRDSYFPQLGLAALLHMAGYPEIEANRRALIIHDPATEARLQPPVQRPNRRTTGPAGMTGNHGDIRIPLTQDGHMLIRWPNKEYIDSFRHLSFLSLFRHENLIRDLAHNLRIMSEQNFLLFHEGTDPLAFYRYAQDLREDLFEAAGRVEHDPAQPSGLDAADDQRSEHLQEGIAEYRQVRDSFIREAETFLSGGAEEKILAEFDRVLAAEGLTQEQRSTLQEKKTQVPYLFSQTRDVLNALKEERETIIQAAEGSICVIGYIGTSTTDIGATPFESEYMNMGLYASVVNTILSGEFYDDTPAWLPVVLAVFLSATVCVSIDRLRPGIAVLVGFGAVVVVIGALILIFRRTGIFIEPIAPGGAVAVSFLAMTSMKFIQTSQERAFIRSAFGQYLSGEVINELVEEGQSPHLGGREIYMTAMFTDVQKFSTISELLSATSLVALLNEYLTAMSDIILDRRGTIDKYEGDAIISFFGAPRELPEHAALACAAAVSMKKTEAALNRKFLAGGTAPRELLTRIGINTGEMVVGNMGTDRKMDYTIMGNAVNLAARLEGVNKVYGTWILAAEETVIKAGDGFLVRRLDRVRVVGIHTPVRLYNIVDFMEEADPLSIEGIESFHAGLAQFEERNWDKAESFFTHCMSAIPGDGPSKIYLSRIQEYKSNEPSGDWDGVFNLTEK